MQIKQEVALKGFALRKSLNPQMSALEVARAIGVPALLDGLRLVQELTPTTEKESTPNTYSGNFGRDEFPLHTDLAHWARPPRYLMLRCMKGDANIGTRILDGLDLIDAIGSARMARCLARPRRPLTGMLHLLPVLGASTPPGNQVLRWDSLFIEPINQSARLVFDSIREWLARTPVDRQILLMPGDTLVIDNWRILHGRERAHCSAIDRVVHRVYLNSLT